jgi:hypothetical protein
VMALYRLHNFEGDFAEEFGLAFDESTSELAVEAARCLPKLPNRLKRDKKDPSALTFEPGKAEPFKFLLFRRATAKALRAINEARKGGSKARRKAQGPKRSAV